MPRAQLLCPPGNIWSPWTRLEGSCVWSMGNANFTTTISIDQILGADDNSISLVERIEDESQKRAFDSYENRMILNDALKLLSPTEQQLIILNYYEGLNQREISDRLQISQMQVSRKLKKSLQKLFEIISKKGLEKYE